MYKKFYNICNIKLYRDHASTYEVNVGNLSIVAPSIYFPLPPFMAAAPAPPLSRRVKKIASPKSPPPHCRRKPAVMLQNSKNRGPCGRFVSRTSRRLPKPALACWAAGVARSVGGATGRLIDLTREGSRWVDRDKARWVTLGGARATSSTDQCVQHMMRYAFHNRLLKKYFISFVRYLFTILIAPLYST